MRRAFVVTLLCGLLVAGIAWAQRGHLIENSGSSITPRRTVINFESPLQAANDGQEIDVTFLKSVSFDWTGAHTFSGSGSFTFPIDSGDPTTEGMCEWDSVNDQIECGDSSGTVSFFGGAHGGGSSAWSESWNAGAMHTDGVECSSPAQRVINGGPMVSFIACPHGTTDTDGFIYGDVVLTPNFVEANDIFFQISAVYSNDDGAKTKEGEIEIQCAGTQEVIDSTWASVQALDLVVVADDTEHDNIIGTSLAVDTDTENCTVGDTLHWRYRSCDTTAAGDNCNADPAGGEDDFHIRSIRAIDAS